MAPEGTQRYIKTGTLHVTRPIRACHPHLRNNARVNELGEVAVGASVEHLLLRAALRLVFDEDTSAGERENVTRGVGKCVSNSAGGNS